jgi:hypothetical protein
MGARSLQDCNEEEALCCKGDKGNNWIRSVARLSTPVELSQYLEIWDFVHALQLVLDQPDSISWNLTANGSYSASSAYHVQFLGSHPRFDA